MSVKSRVADWIAEQREEMTEFLLEFSNIPSPRGHEHDAVEFMYEWLDGHDIPVRRQHVISGRENVIASLPPGGSGDGSSLLFNGHLDTAFGNPDEDRWITATDVEAHSSAWRDGDYLIGDDVVNDKGPVTAFLWAGRALQELPLALNNEVLLTGTVGEIGGATVDDWQDPAYIGGGVGTRRLVEGGVTADVAVVAECSDYGIARVEPGMAWFKIDIEADVAYQPYVALSDAGAIERDHPGAVPKLARAILALERWAVDYAEGNTLEYDHGTVRLTAGVGAVKSGNPYDPDKSPGYATLYLDVRLPPGETPGFVREPLGDVLAEAGVDATVTPYCFRRGYVADSTDVAPLVDGIAAAHDTVVGGDPPTPPTEITSIWRDSNVFNEAGVPSVSFGPPRVQPDDTPAVGKAIAIHEDELVRAAQMYALTAIEVCGVSERHGS